MFSNVFLIVPFVGY